MRKPSPPRVIWRCGSAAASGAYVPFFGARAIRRAVGKRARRAAAHATVGWPEGSGGLARASAGLGPAMWACQLTLKVYQGVTAATTFHVLPASLSRGALTTLSTSLCGILLPFRMHAATTREFCGV